MYGGDRDGGSDLGVVALGAGLAGVGVMWTPELVKDRLCQAASTLKRMRIKVMPDGYRSYWPDYLDEGIEAETPLNPEEAYLQLVRERETKVSLPPPLAKSIDQMDESLDWLIWIRQRKTQRVVWYRACGMPWRKISSMVGGTRQWLSMLEKSGLKTIARELNDRNRPIG